MIAMNLLTWLCFFLPFIIDFKHVFHRWWLLTVYHLYWLKSLSSSLIFTSTCIDRHRWKLKILMMESFGHARVTLICCTCTFKRLQMLSAFSQHSTIKNTTITDKINHFLHQYHASNQLLSIPIIWAGLSPQFQTSASTSEVFSFYLDCTIYARCL